MAAAKGRKVAEGRGSVYAGGKVYVEGATVPDDVEVGAHIFEPVDPVVGGESRVEVQVVTADDDESGDAKSSRGKS